MSAPHPTPAVPRQPPYRATRRHLLGAALAPLLGHSRVLQAKPSGSLTASLAADLLKRNGFEYQDSIHHASARKGSLASTWQDLSPVREALQVLKVQRITLSDFTQLTDLSALTDLKSLTDLSLSQLDSLPDLSALAGLPKLESLRITACGSLQGAALKTVAQTPTLRTLSLMGCPGLLTADVQSAVAGLTKLTLLSLHGLQTLQDTDFLYMLTALKGLHLDACGSLSGPKALKGIAHLSKLEFLTLEYCTSLDDISPLFQLGNLDTLSLRGCRAVKMEDFEKLRAFIRKKHGPPPAPEINSRRGAPLLSTMGIITKGMVVGP